MISAASHHFSLPAMAFKITSCIFITRSISAAGNCCSMASTSSSFSRPPFERTFHLLIEADKSHATDSATQRKHNMTFKNLYNPAETRRIYGENLLHDGWG